MEEILRELVNELKVHNRLLARTIVNKEEGIPVSERGKKATEELSKSCGDIIQWAAEVP